MIKENTKIELVDTAAGDPSKALLFIPGYLSNSKNQGEDLIKWKDQIRYAGWKGVIYYLFWDSSNIKTLAVLISSFLSAKRLPILPSQLFYSNILLGATGFKVHWDMVKKRAEEVGRMEVIPLIKQNIPQNSVTIMGHSVGVRILYFSLLKSKESSNMFDNAVLLGGAISRDADRDWERCSLSVKGKIVNIYHPDDKILKYLYKAGQLSFKSPCGLEPIRYESPKIININSKTYLTEYKKTNHWVYPEVLKDTIGKFWEQ